MSRSKLVVGGLRIVILHFLLIIYIQSEDIDKIQQNNKILTSHVNSSKIYKLVIMANTIINNSNEVENPFRILTMNEANLGVQRCKASPAASGASSPATNVAMRVYGTPMCAFANTTCPRENSQAGITAGKKKIYNLEHV